MLLPFVVKYVHFKSIMNYYVGHVHIQARLPAAVWENEPALMYGIVMGKEF